MFSKPNGFGFARHNWLPPRDPIEKSNTRDFFYFTGGDSVASCTVTIHLPRSKKPAPIDPLPIHHAAPLVSIPGSLSPLSSCYRMGCAIDRTRILTSSFVNCRRGTLVDVILVEDSYVDWLFEEGICSSRIFSRDD